MGFGFILGLNFLSSIYSLVICGAILEIDHKLSLFFGVFTLKHLHSTLGKAHHTISLCKAFPLFYYY